jgi:predicted nucleic acid-binding protein
VIARLVCDASALSAVLLDSGDDGVWATEALTDADLAAPALLPWETANVIRRQELGGAIGSDQAAQAHGDLVDLSIELWPYELLAPRAWQLRNNLSIYDAGYVALAETLDVELVTLDRRIARAPGISCIVTTPPQ